jgi:dUTP pyrophosphatase
MNVEIEILDPRLTAWGFPSWGSALAAGLDLHACLDGPLTLAQPAPPELISAGLALGIGEPEWCALVLPRSGMGHRQGLVLGNGIGVMDADYTGPCLISAWNRNPAPSGSAITIRPGDRIAQLVFTRIARLQLAIVSALSRAAGRGWGGFGSTGVEVACSSRPAGPNL